MARRLSSMFGMSKDDSLETIQPPNPSQFLNPHTKSPVGSPKMGKLPKQRTLSKSPSLLDLATADTALPLPPVLTDMGIRSSSRDSRRSSRTDSHGTRASSGSRSRPSTPTHHPPSIQSSPGQNNATPGKLAKRRTWFTGRTDKQDTADYHGMIPTEAWLAGLKDYVRYDVTPLVQGERVAELWNPDADVDVYLFPPSTNRGPSFRVSSSLFADSQIYRDLGESIPYNSAVPVSSLEPPMQRMSLHDTAGAISRKPLAKSQTMPTFVASNGAVLQQKVLHLPIDLQADYSVVGTTPTKSDIELLVLYRNFVSFLNGGSLVSTTRQNTLYSIFLGIGTILRTLKFGNEKGSSWGAVPWASFSMYTDELKLADVAYSREKNIEAIVLGEAMRSWPLYNAGFTHAVGRWDEVKAIKSPKFSRISPITLNRIERATFDLQGRLATVRTKLENFDFPAMFAGIANSQTSTEAKLVHFKAWKIAFLECRGFIMSHYKKRYGAWPPKASSKKNNFEENGLNRLLLQEVYHDFADLYDMLVDRQSLTTRTVDMPSIATDARSGSHETIQHVLRSVESEHDRSVPPVMPPIPFDVPLIPAFANSFSREHILARTDPNARRLKDSDVNALLLGSYNRESIKPTPFCQQFLQFERKLGTGKTVQELVDNRCGQWLFLYAVLQALPMTVVDARDLKFTEGCENFLCIPPRGGRPWMKEDTSTSRAWYNVASGGGLVSLPADLIDHSVEGIYRRSHCWQVATKWAEELPSSIAHTHVHAHNGEAINLPPNTIDMIQPTAPLPPTTNGLLAPSAGPGSQHTSPMMRPQSANGAVDPGFHLSLPNNPTGPATGGLSRSARSSFAFGLEETVAPLPAAQPRPAAVLNPNITFDNILGNNNTKTSGKQAKKGKKK